MFKILRNGLLRQAECSSVAAWVFLLSIHDSAFSQSSPHAAYPFNPHSRSWIAISTFRMLWKHHLEQGKEKGRSKGKRKSKGIFHLETSKCLIYQSSLTLNTCPSSLLQLPPLRAAHLGLFGVESLGSHPHNPFPPTLTLPSIPLPERSI